MNDWQRVELRENLKLSENPSPSNPGLQSTTKTIHRQFTVGNRSDFAAVKRTNAVEANSQVYPSLLWRCWSVGRNSGNHNEHRNKAENP
jgi:hypothetical protein